MDDDLSGAAPFVVIADDDPGILRLIEVTLKRAGYDVAAVSDGESALRLIRERRPDLVLLDVSMPIRTGLEVGKELQADEGLRDLPIVFLTAHSQESDVLEGFRSGAVDYLFKPFSPRELRARVRGLLARPK